MTLAYKSSDGSYFPPGATVSDVGVNFSVFSRHASRAEFLLYEAAGSPKPFQIIRLNPKKKLIDPWATAVTDVFWNRQRASDPNDESSSSYRAVVAKSDYLWADDERSCKRGLEGAVIYKLHVGGFTRHPSAGVDEVLHTQKGNNNSWCQDNELSWFDWNLVEKNSDMLRFVKELIALRRRHPNLNRSEFLTGERVTGRGLRDIAWHGYRLDEPLWFDYSAQYLAYTLAGLADDEEDLHVILNMSERTVEAFLPEIPGLQWHLALDTSRSGQDDIMPRNQQEALEGTSYQISGRMVAVFEARR